MTTLRNLKVVVLLLVLLFGIFNVSSAGYHFAIPKCWGACVDGDCDYNYRIDYYGGHGCSSGQRCCVESDLDCPGECSVEESCPSGKRRDVYGDRSCSIGERCCVEEYDDDAMW